MVDQAVAERYHRAGWWRERTVVDDFLDVVAARPDAPAVVSYRAGHPEPHRLTYAELGRLVDRFAGALLNLGVGRGDVVSLQLPNGWEFAALTLACGRIGAIVNPLVPIFRHRELSFILGKTRSRVCVVPRTFRGFAHGELLADLARELPDLEHAFVLDGDRSDPMPAGTPAGTKSFEAQFLDQRWEDDPGLGDVLAARRPAGDDVAEIQFTSGTTGEPKGVVHTWNTLWSAARVFPEALGVSSGRHPDRGVGDGEGADERDGDVAFMASTLAHQTGFLYGLLVPMGWGLPVVYQDVWDPRAFVQLCDTERISYTMGATPFVMDAIAAQSDIGASLATLRLFGCGGAPIPPHLVAASQEVLGAELIAVWGMTENGIVTCTRPGDPVEVVANSDGVPVPWMELRIVSLDGDPLPPGEIGHLQVRGANQAVGYFGRPDLYEASLRPADDDPGDPWFDSGDLAWRRHQDGGVRISGRAKDLVIRGGENVPVVEVEAVLYTHPAVREVAVVGYPDDRLGERTCAVVAPEDPDRPPSLADLVAHCEAAGMARQFWPERLVLVDEMPKTPSGKIQKFVLRERVREAAGV
jgi:cyclohexanecarboxylate-CoA ligase